MSTSVLILPIRPRVRRNLVLPAVVLIVGAIPLLHAGEIAGRVVSASDESPVPGANVVLQGTLRGSVSDRDGRFQLSEVDPGRYSLAVSCIGYEREIVRDVVVPSGASESLVVKLHPVPIQTEPVVVTASKREQSLQDVPVSFSLMEAKTIDDRNFPSVEDAMRYVSGVNLVDTQVSIRGSSGYSRGAGSRVLMLVDGIPLLTGDTGELNFETIPIGQVDHIEVLKGAGSALYGSNAIGGVINVVTKPPPETPKTSVRGYGGMYAGPSYPQWDWGGGTRFIDGFALSHARTVGNTGIVLHGATTGDEGYRQNNQLRRYNGYARIRQQFSPRDALTGTFNIFHQSRGSFLYWKDLSNALVPPDAQQGDYVQSTRFFVSSQYQHLASADFMTVVRAIWYRNNFRDNIDTASHRSLSDMLRTEVQFSWKASESHVLTMGMEGNLEFVDADLFGNRSGIGAGLYAQDEVTLGDPLLLTFGARFDIQDLDSLRSNSELSPKLGVVWKPAPATRVRGSVGRGFRSPTAAEAFTTTTLSVITIVPNPDLKAERSVSYEVGLNQLLGENMLLDVALFQSDFSNLIEPRIITGTTGQFINVTRARVQGVEANWSLGFSRSLFLNLGYTYTNPRDLTLDDVLKYRHRHLLYISASWEQGMFAAGVDFRYLSRVERIDEELTAVIPDADARVAVYVTDLRAGLRLAPGGTPLSLTFNVKNLFQYNYVDFVGSIGQPRSYVLTVEAEL